MLAALLALELVGLTLFQASRIGEEHEKLTEVQQKETEVTQVQKLAQEATSKRAEVKPIKDKTDFINALLAYNKVRPNLTTMWPPTSIGRFGSPACRQSRTC